MCTGARRPWFKIPGVFFGRIIDTVYNMEQITIFLVGGSMWIFRRDKKGSMPFQRIRLRRFPVKKRDV
jgi:hypothetical protein